MYAQLGRPAKPVRLMVGLLLLKQIENLSDERVVEAWVQNPYFRGRKHMGKTTITLPEAPSAKATDYEKRKARHNFGRRSAIEPVIGHLKSDFRLAATISKAQ